MILHNDEKAFKQAISYASDKLKILPIYIEKDYWVTYALKILFSHSEISQYLVFKGGTSLAKCYELISRFSEDIDLVILRNNEETDNQSKKKIKAISEKLSKFLPEIEIDGITHKKGKIRKTAHSYSRNFEGNFGQVREFIVLEATWLGYYEPYTQGEINSLIGKVLYENNQQELATLYELCPFEIRVLDVKRTLCEKVMSLVRFSHDENPISALQNKIRHLYDIHQILGNGKFEEFFNSSEFDEMLNKVANDDVQSFKNNNDWIKYPPKNALIFSDENVWELLKPTYLNEFSKLIYGDLPKSSDISQTLTKLRNRISKVSWEIMM
ncbi:nucleotidyl transferase AbiEii/AbiGii toxin family protein [Haemophilus haemoglobinophilus]|nr:nucleotidyl transferase AbiEii/AbiGii toxin family protein [Canicola haemoglobinophilus]